MTRTYKLQRRAERQDKTRQRIVDATIDLHQTIGPMMTKISDVAERAGVGRVTVYRHFADEAALSAACSGHYYATHPFPDADAWRAIADPEERLRTGLDEAYAYHRRTEAMMTRVLAQAYDHPAVAPYHAFWQEAADALAAAWPLNGVDKAQMAAGIALAIAFTTWRKLVRERGLSDAQAVELMMRLTCRTSSGRARRKTR